MLRYLLLGGKIFFDFSHLIFALTAQRSFVSHNATEAFLCSQESTGDPALNHRRIFPATDSIGSRTYTSVRAFNHVGCRQAPMQAGGHLEPVDCEALLQALQQTGRGGRAVPL